MLEYTLSLLERIGIIDSWLPISSCESINNRRFCRVLFDKESRLIVLSTNTALFHIFLRLPVK